MTDNQIFTSYKDRMRRLALLDPLYGLKSKRKKDLRDQTIDMFEMGLITLLFFFESKLTRNKETGVEELSDFLYKTLQKRYDLDKKDYSAYARTMIETFRPPSGRKLEKVFYDFERHRESRVAYSILKAGHSDLHKNKQYYELDEDGLELIFATSEYFSEYQISISQMLLRKQLEKGQFMSALRQIDEMRLSVNMLKERMFKLKREINRNVTSEGVYENYKNLIDDINRRLELENKEFDALQAFVFETVQRLKNDLRVDKDREIYQNAQRVNQELEQVHHMHNSLLGESINIKKSALAAAKESLYYIGVESFNFNKEIVSRIVSEPLGLDKVKTLAKPFMYMEKAIVWSPLAVFFHQRVISKGQEEATTSYADLKDENPEDSRVIETIYQQIMKVCMAYLQEDDTLYLSDLIEHLKMDEKAYILEARYFYDFWISIHQFSPIDLTYEEADKPHNVLVEALHELKNKYKLLNIVESKNIIKVNEAFHISDMVLKLERIYEL